MPLTKYSMIKAAGTELHQIRDVEVVLKTELEAELPMLLELLGLSTELRTQVASGGIGGLVPPQASLDDLDDWLEDEADRIRDQLDYFDDDHENRVENLTVRDGAWYLPEALEAPLPDDDGNPAAQAIDNDGTGPNSPLNNTYWQSNSNGTRSLIVRLRSYRKRVEGIQLRTNDGDLRAQVQNVTVKAAPRLNKLDDPDCLVGSAVNFTRAGSSWTEFQFVKNNCRYIKLEIPESLHTNPDHVRVRSLRVRVGIKQHKR